MLAREKYIKRTHASSSNIVYIKPRYLQISLYKQVSLLGTKYIAYYYFSYLTFVMLARYINVAY
jgi:hypothetical protein